MCGIAGVVTSGRPMAEPTEMARRLAAALAHRGPDGEGVWTSPAADVLLVHRRLAIIDPGPGGAQPMTSADGRHRIVFNGEIYNYRELRREVEARGERFATASDTEVLLRCVARDGRRAWRACAACSRSRAGTTRDGRCFVARDRFGIKPLYLAAGADRLAFASELGALRAACLVDGEPSAAGVLGFLAWGSVRRRSRGSAASRCCRRAPGCRWRDGRDERGASPTCATRTRAQASTRAIASAICAPRVGAAVRDSVRAHLVADVPVGVFLSGGIDSGAIVSAATSAGAANLQTFTVAVRRCDRRKASAARRVARLFGTDASRTARRRAQRRAPNCPACSRGSISRRSTRSTRSTCRAPLRRPASRRCCRAPAATRCSAATRRSGGCRARSRR